MYARGLSLSFGATVIYDNAEFNIGNNDKCGIIGVNGAGKTTLFRLIMGQIEPDMGQINADDANIAYLPQQIVFETPDITVWDFLLSGRPIDALQNKLNDLYIQLADSPDDMQIATQIANTQERLEYYDVYNAEDQLLDIISNMDIDSDMLDIKLQNLSGGQKSKVAFARMLYSKASVLLLDEPTNHLDIKTKDWVAAYLKKYRGCVLIISHDNEFLNKIVNRILYIDKITHKTSVFDGNYDDYKRKSTALRHARDVKIATEERQIKNLSDFIARANAASPTNHSIKRVGKTREKVLEKILANRTLREQTYKKIKMDLSPRTTGATHPIHVDDLWFRFPGARLLYRKLSFYITGGERFLIVGENGTGKSTLLKLIMGLYTPERGTITINPKTDIAYYAQELELLDKDKTVLENVSSDEYTELQLRSILANFLFYDTDVFKKLSVLSPGEQARVALCKMLLKRANMLILDEPTNHLDPDTQRIIGDNFRDFPGTIIAVSHNPDFVEQIGITRMLTLPDGHIRDYDHDLLEYYYNINTAKN